MCWKQPPRDGWDKQLRTAISPPFLAAPMGACDSTPSSSSALLRGQGLPADSSAVLELEEEQALADQALDLLPGRATGGSEKFQGHPPRPVSSSKQLMLMLCRRQLQGSKTLLLCTSLLLLQPGVCLLLQPTARILWATCHDLQYSY